MVLKQRESSGHWNLFTIYFCRLSRISRMKKLLLTGDVKREGEGVTKYVDDARKLFVLSFQLPSQIGSILTGA